MQEPPDDSYRGSDREPDRFIQLGPEPHQRYPAWSCDACDDPDLEPFTIGAILLCRSCAGVAANLWEYAGSGKYLTWTNPPAPGPKPRAKISARKRRRIYERDAYRCQYCGGFDNLVLDHVNPVSQGGDDSDENLVTACWECNSTKGGRTPSEAGMRLRPNPGSV